MRDRYLLELLDTCLKTMERQIRRIEQADREDLDTLRLIQHELHVIVQELQPPPPPSTLATSITFKQTNGDHSGTT
jgi:hypothetical protein